MTNNVHAGSTVTAEFGPRKSFSICNGFVVIPFHLFCDEFLLHEAIYFTVNTLFLYKTKTFKNNHF